MYHAMYFIREDGDGELVAIFADNETVYDELANDIRITLTGRMNVHEGPGNWFIKTNGDPDFPSVWDCNNEPGILENDQ
jgi:hypothetical protein